MKTINKPLDNLGGLLKIWAVPKNVILLNGKDITFSDTSEIYQLYCTPGSMAMEEREEKSKGGSFFNTSISAFIPKDSEEVRLALNDMQGKPYLIIYIDGNENFKLAGTFHFPLRSTATLITGQAEQQRAGHEILFSGKTRERSVFVNNPF